MEVTMIRNVLTICAIVLLMTASACSRPHPSTATYGDGETAMERGTKKMEDLIEKTVKDPDKARKVKAVVNDIVEEAKQSSKQKREAHRKLYTLNADYNAAPEDFLKILDDSNNQSMQSASRILGLRYKIKEMLTPEEWKGLTEGMQKYGSRYWGPSSSNPQ
jgi:Spy/CpxP family protein refolding chaperone